MNAAAPWPVGAASTQQPFWTPGDVDAPLEPRPVLSNLSADSTAELLAPVDRGLNPIVAAATLLLALSQQLRVMPQVADVAALRRELAAGVREFTARVTAQGVPPVHVTAACYILCTLLDEAAAETPWGAAGQWAQRGLAAQFANDANGGERIFDWIKHFAQPSQRDEHRHLLELIYCCLALGFEGRYKQLPNGEARLAAVRDKLGQVISQLQGAHSAALSQQWQVKPRPARYADGGVKLAAATAVVCLLLVVTYTWLAQSLAAKTSVVAAQVQALRLPPPVVASAEVAAPPRLAQFLQPEIQAGLVAVRDDVDRSVITIRGDGAFAAGSAALLPHREALMGRIADALAQVPGRVLVTGHTDSQPIRSAQFPTNQHLSLARALSVRELLVRRRVDPARIQAQGRGDAEPAARNDTVANRALNRRVEVTLWATAAGSPTSSSTGQP